MITEETTQSATGFSYPAAADLQTLSRAEGPCITIILAPHAGGTGSRPSGTTLKTLLPEIRQALLACNVNPQDVESLLEPVEAITEEAALRAGHENPLCIFRSPREFHRFSVRAVVEPGWHVEERFFVQPILAHLDYRKTFLLLALAAKHMRLLRCEGGEITAIPFPDGVPESGWEFIGETEDGEQNNGRPPTVKAIQSPGLKSPNFFGDLMKAIDRGLQPVYREQGLLPLVLAGVDEETAAYRTVSEYSSLVPQGLKLSPDGGVTGKELAHAAAEILKHWSSPAEKQALADFAAMGTGRRSTDSTAILEAAATGKVQHLFVRRGARIPGDVQRILGLGGEGYVYRSADLVNAATVEVLKHKGTVWLLEPEQMPEPVALAAVMRYADDKTGV